MTATAAPDYRTTLTPHQHCAGCWWLNDCEGRPVAIVTYDRSRWNWRLTTAGWLLLGAAYPGPHSGYTRTLTAALDHLRHVVFIDRLKEDQ